MNSEQTGEDIFFSKMTSFSLLKFKFTQIFLMAKMFLKMTDFLKNRSIIQSNQLIIQSNWPNFGFLKFSYSFHSSTSFWPDFSGFYRILLIF
jgi:hypothetical protein